LALLLWVGRAAWVYGQVLFAPLRTWAERWRYAPLLGLLALGGALRAWIVMERAAGRGGFDALVRPITPSLLILSALVGTWWWVTTPAVVRTVPAQGATGVPRDTVIHIEMRPQRREVSNPYPDPVPINSTNVRELYPFPGRP
jgi:hypothetical protein